MERKMFVSRKCVKLYDNVWEIISQIKSKKAQKEVALATIQYAFRQKVDFPLSGIAYATFIGIKGILDAAWRGYNNAKEKDNQDNKQELPTRQPDGQPMGLPDSLPQRQPNGQPDRLPPNSISRSISRREEKDKEEGEAEAEAEAEVGNRGEGERTSFRASREALSARADAEDLPINEVEDIIVRSLNTLNKSKPDDWMKRLAKELHPLCVKDQKKGANWRNNVFNAVIEATM